jgi:hypothetical protein
MRTPRFLFATILIAALIASQAPMCISVIGIFPF